MGRSVVCPQIEQVPGCGFLSFPFKSRVVHSGCGLCGEVAFCLFRGSSGRWMDCASSGGRVAVPGGWTSGNHKFGASCAHGSGWNPRVVNTFIPRLWDLVRRCVGQFRACCLMRLVSSVTWLKTLRRSAMSSRIFRSACMTVVWSRPPNCWPIFGRERSVSSRQRYIAI